MVDPLELKMATRFDIFIKQTEPWPLPKATLEAAALKTTIAHQYWEFWREWQPQRKWREAFDAYFYERVPHHRKLLSERPMVKRANGYGMVDKACTKGEIEAGLLRCGDARHPPGTSRLITDNCFTLEGNPYGVRCPGCWCRSFGQSGE